MRAIFTALGDHLQCNAIIISKPNTNAPRMDTKWQSISNQNDFMWFDDPVCDRTIIFVDSFEHKYFVMNSYWMVETKICVINSLPWHSIEQHQLNRFIKRINCKAYETAEWMLSTRRVCDCSCVRAWPGTKELFECITHNDSPVLGSKFKMHSMRSVKSIPFDIHSNQSNVHRTCEWLSVEENLSVRHAIIDVTIDNSFGISGVKNVYCVFSFW